MGIHDEKRTKKVRKINWRYVIACIALLIALSPAIIQAARGTCTTVALRSDFSFIGRSPAGIDISERDYAECPGYL